ncbi:hypothetical protein K1X76_06585 [bacterium]|nr:hypothetical protein [bacterium]
MLGNVKETRLTACLAYLIALYPKHIGKLFTPPQETIQKISVEIKENETDRYDIVIETNFSLIILEAKLGLNQLSQQITRYIKNLKSKKKIILYLLDSGSHGANTWIRHLPKKTKQLSILWSDVHAYLVDFLKTKTAKQNTIGWALAQEFLKHLEANAMTAQNTKEVYVRDISGESISMLFKDRIYRCQPQFYASALGNRYFAPYFTTNAPQDFSKNSLIRIEKGISWMFPIKEMQKIRTKDVKSFLKEQKHPHYNEVGKKAVKGHAYEDILVFILGEPFLVFPTPIPKNKLKIKGAMGSRTFTFETLFGAARRGE